MCNTWKASTDRPERGRYPLWLLSSTDIILTSSITQQVSSLVSPEWVLLPHFVYYHLEANGFDPLCTHTWAGCYIGYTTRRRSHQLIRRSQPLSERSDSSLDKKPKVRPIGTFWTSIAPQCRLVQPTLRRLSGTPILCSYRGAYPCQKP